MKNSKKLSIIIPEECSIPALYDAVAEAAGKNPKVQRYDCRKIDVSKDIYAAYEKYMTESGQGESIGAFWLCMGPKVRDYLKDCEVEIQDGFFCK